jgi:hypothetical protein
VLDYATGLAQQVANRLMTAETATLQTFDFMHSTQPPSRYIAHPEARADSHARPGPAEHEAPAPSGAPKADHTHKGYDTDNHGLDSYGNATERKQSRAAHVMDGQHRVFETSFTTIRDAALYPGPTDQKKLPHPLPDGSRVRLGAVATSRVQIITGDISAADHVWIDFAALGGHGADLGLGNERHDAADNQRGAAIRDGLPGGRQPGSRKFTWGFGGGFLPALDGVALDGSLMTKVHALMEWAIYNDMVLGDIRITSGMRSPRTAHFLCVRYEIGESKMARVSMEDLQRLPDGRDHDGNQWYQPGWTRQQIIDNALSKYEKGSKHAVAAAGYDFGDPRRAPLPLSSAPGVSRHCSGHAVDVDIPWRSAADPNERDLWGWEQIYHQFGLTRPLHRDRGFSGSKPESWHVEETGKSLATEAGE